MDSAGHGQTSILTSKLFQVTSPFFLCIYQWLVLLKPLRSLFSWPLIFPIASHNKCCAVSKCSSPGSRNGLHAPVDSNFGWGVSQLDRLMRRFQAGGAGSGCSVFSSGITWVPPIAVSLCCFVVMEMSL